MQCAFRLKKTILVALPNRWFFFFDRECQFLFFPLCIPLLTNLCIQWVYLDVFIFIVIDNWTSYWCSAYEKKWVNCCHFIIQFISFLRVSFMMIESQCLKQIEGRIKVIAADTAYIWSCFQKSNISALLSILRVHNSWVFISGVIMW